jgi:hypothetical protein
MQDFPAAHSMDTTWFAIDADGCVGIFNSSEGGAVPKALPALAQIEGVRIEASSDLLDILIDDRQELFQHNSSVKIEPILDYLSIDTGLEGKFLSIDALLEEISSHERYALLNHSYERDLNIISEQILQLSNERVIEDLKSQCTILIRFADEKIIVYVDKCNLEWLKKSIELGAVIAGAPTMYLEDNLSWLGWYEYDCGEQYPAPYQRIYSIDNPILFSDLPPEIVEHIRVIRLKNIRFAETDKIQPIEHMLCYTWGTERWIDTNGVEHDRFPEYPNLDRAKD